ncbi:MAG: Fe-S cluster assembly protein HesB [archaeon]
MLSQKKVKEVQRTILDHYAKHGRNLPWRKTTNPYKILVSEVMLQQTQVDRVIPKYAAFIKKFPTLQTLARAKKENVLKLWSGLGYNSRAVRLQRLARHVVNAYKGKFPQTYKELLALPGIGPYTAKAVLIFAYNKGEITIDTNVRRILIALLHLSEKTPQATLERYALALLPKGRSRDWHNALMDYGAMVLTARKTGIKPVSKQSPFKDSDRYYRGQILKKHLHKQTHSANVLGISPSRYARILRQMRKEGLLE